MEEEDDHEEDEEEVQKEGKEDVGVRCLNSQRSGRRTRKLGREGEEKAEKEVEIVMIM